MKRSNRLVLLIGIFLAIVAFVLIFVLLSGNRGGTSTPEAPTTKTIVVAIDEIPLGAQITAEMVEEQTVEIAKAAPDGFNAESLVISQIVRQKVLPGTEITQRTLGVGTTGQCQQVDTPALQRSIAVQVDQVTGVGTLIKPGDYVDVVVGFTGDKFPVVTVNPEDNGVTVVSGLNSTSVKLLLQGIQVLCSLLPPVQAVDNQGQPVTDQGTALTGQQEIVIMSVTPQQAEVIKFAQMDGNISLVLRNAGEFLDPVTGEPIQPVTDATTGVTLKVLVDGGYGVLPPEVIQGVLPEQP